VEADAQTNEGVARLQSLTVTDVEGLVPGEDCSSDAPQLIGLEPGEQSAVICPAECRLIEQLVPCIGRAWGTSLTAALSSCHGVDAQLKKESLLFVRLTVGIFPQRPGH
jgi:hypothetical protein